MGTISRLFVACLFFVVGCGDETARPAASAKAPSLAKDAVDTVIIQKQAIDAGKSATKQLQAIDADRKKQMKEAGEP